MVTGFQVPVILRGRRAGDPPVLVSTPSKDPDEIVRTAWALHRRPDYKLRKLSGLCGAMAGAREIISSPHCTVRLVHLDKVIVTPWLRSFMELI
jgi:hypothetical protein